MPDKQNYRLDFRPEDYEPVMDAEFVEVGSIEAESKEGDAEETCACTRVC